MYLIASHAYNMCREDVRSCVFTAGDVCTDKNGFTAVLSSLSAMLSRFCRVVFVGVIVVSMHLEHHNLCISTTNIV